LTKKTEPDNVLFKISRERQEQVFAFPPTLMKRLGLRTPCEVPSRYVGVALAA
jgi:hypothetical protein